MKENDITLSVAIMRVGLRVFEWRNCGLSFFEARDEHMPNRTSGRRWSIPGTVTALVVTPRTRRRTIGLIYHSGALLYLQNRRSLAFYSYPCAGILNRGTYFIVHQSIRMAYNSSSNSATTTVDQDATSHEKVEDHSLGEAPGSPLQRPVSQAKAAAEKQGPLTENVHEEQQPNVSGLQRALIILPVTLVYFLVMLDSSIISTAIPKITDEFDSLLDVGWYGSAYQLASSAFVPLAGKIYSFFSIKVRQSSEKLFQVCRVLTGDISCL